MNTSEFIGRQFRLLAKAVEDYRLGYLSLDSLVRRIEGLSAAIDSTTWSIKIRPIILSLEQVNAAVIEANIPLSVANTAIVNRSLEELAVLLSAELAG